MLKLILILLLSITCVFAEETLWDYKKTTVPTVPSPAPDIKKAPVKIPEKPILHQEKPDYMTVPVPIAPIQRGNIITKADLDWLDIPASMAKGDMVMDIAQIVGQEAKRTLQQGKPILLKDTGKMILVERNQEVSLIFYKGSMMLTTTGRVLDKGGAGDHVRVMNLESRKIITGIVTETGEVDVSL